MTVCTKLNLVRFHKNEKGNMVARFELKFTSENFIYISYILNNEKPLLLEQLVKILDPELNHCFLNGIRIQGQNSYDCHVIDREGDQYIFVEVTISEKAKMKFRRKLIETYISIIKYIQEKGLLNIRIEDKYNINLETIDLNLNENLSQYLKDLEIDKEYLTKKRQDWYKL